MINTCGEKENSHSNFILSNSCIPNFEERELFSNESPTKMTDRNWDLEVKRHHSTSQQLELFNTNEDVKRTRAQTSITSLSQTNSKITSQFAIQMKKRASATYQSQKNLPAKKSWDFTIKNSSESAQQLLMRTEGPIEIKQGLFEKHPIAFNKSRSNTIAFTDNLNDYSSLFQSETSEYESFSNALNDISFEDKDATEDKLLMKEKNPIWIKIRSTNTMKIKDSSDIINEFSEILKKLKFIQKKDQLLSTNHNSKPANQFSTFFSFFLCISKKQVTAKQEFNNQLSIFSLFMSLNLKSTKEGFPFEMITKMFALTSNLIILSLENGIKKSKSNDDQLILQETYQDTISSLFLDLFKDDAESGTDLDSEMDSINGVSLICLFQFVQKYYQSFPRIVKYFRFHKISIFKLFFELQNDFAIQFKKKMFDYSFLINQKVLKSYCFYFLTFFETFIFRLKPDSQKTSLPPIPDFISSFLLTNVKNMKMNQTTSNHHLESFLTKNGF